jgi:hypothetical protein
MAGYNNKIVAVIVFSAIMTIATQSSYSSVQSLAQEDSGEPEIPQAICNYAGQKYYLTPHIYNDGERSSRMDFPDLPDDYVPQMIVKKGDKLTMEFEGDKQPAEIQVILVDYDADITETYPLEKVDENTFEATETGMKTLEVIATFPGNERISYTTLIDVKDNS